MTTVAIVLAGGSGSRMPQGDNKVYLPLAGRSLLSWSLAAFECSPAVDRIVLVVRDGEQERAAQVAKDINARKVRHIVPGGATRHESERAGLEAISAAIEKRVVRLVAIHDGARPFVTQQLVKRVVETAQRIGGAVPGLELDGEFVLRVDGNRPPVPVSTTKLRRVQTPQAFRALDLLMAHRRASSAGFDGVDTAASVERFSDLEVRVVPGDVRNIKVTFASDFLAAQEIALTWDADA